MNLRLSVVCGALVAAILAALPAGPVRGAGGHVLTFPQPGTKIKSGLFMTVDFRGVDGNGYRPVRIEFRTLTGAPLTADRQVRVVLAPFSYNATSTPEVSQVIDLPEGSVATSATIAVPQSSLWYSCSIKVIEDGDELPDLSTMNVGWPGVNYWDWSEARPVMLFIDGKVPGRAARDGLVAKINTSGVDPSPEYNLPQIRILNNLFPDPNQNNFFTDQKLSDATMLKQIADQPRMEMLPPSELPERWIELSQFDLAVIPLADLKALAAGEPKRFKALTEWAAGGPLLIVTGVGDDFAGLAQIDKLLALPKVPVPVDADNPSSFHGWTGADNEDHLPIMRSEIEDLQSSMGIARNPAWQGQVYQNPGISRRPIDPLDPSQKPLAAPRRTPFALRPNGLGMVVGIASDNPFPGEENDWRWVFNSVPRSHWMWYQRHGFSLHRTNDDYWKFLIPGVGQAPVVSFLLLVSLFAVLIGPVNYMLLGRAQRLYLLLITVPIGALVVTGSLFTYALLTDGLGVRLRARSFTEIDQQSGRAVAWSRQSYYASISPSRGLLFPDDATVFQVLHHPGGFRSSNRPQHKLNWDEGQTLADGYMTSRTATQFMVLRVTESKDKLSVREGPSAGQPPEVTNSLRTGIRLVVLRDSRGEFWLGDDLDNEASAKLTATTAKAAAEKLRKLYSADPPEFPEGYDPNTHNNALSIFMPNYAWYNVDNSASQPVMASSLLESNLASSLDPGSSLLPGSYLAVTLSSPVVPYGVPRVREEASLHMIRGRY